VFLVDVIIDRPIFGKLCKQNSRDKPIPMTVKRVVVVHGHVVIMYMNATMSAYGLSLIHS